MRNTTGRGSSGTRGFNARSWNPEKHGRDKNGRFTDMPDLPKTRTSTRSVAREAQRLYKDAKQYRRLQIARAEILTSLSVGQRARLTQIVSKRPQALLGQPSKVTNSTKVPKVKEKSKRKPRTPTARKVVSSDSLSTSANKVELWANKKEEYLPQKGYKVKSQKGYEYTVQYEGKVLSLNTNKNRATYDGEVVNGIPPLTPNLRKLDNKRVVAAMAQYAAYAEDKSNDPPVPKWANIHGTPGKEYLSAKGLGQMQLHHQGQWSKRNFQDITDKYEKGEITLDQAKQETGKLLRPYEKTNSKGETYTKYEIAVAPKSDREFVLLPGGAHDFTSPLYEANHPLAIHPVTGKLEKFGIPEKGRTTDGNRDEYDTFRAGFWRETYKREAKLLSGELTRRLRKGQVTQEQVKELWQDARTKQQDFRKYVLSLKKDTKITSNDDSP